MMLTFHKRGSGPALILIHAFPFSSKMWSELVSSLSDLDISIATIDLPGFGSTPNAEWTMESISQEIYEAITSEGIERPILCGLSMGGYIALSYCKNYPLTVAGLILADTKAAADPEEVKQDREKFAQDALKRGAIAGTERNLAKMTSEWTKQNAPDVAKQIESWMLEADPQAIANALRAMAGRPDTMEMLASISVPVLLIVGEEDKVTPPSEMEKMAAVLPNATVVKIKDASHMSANEKPREFADAIREYFKLSS
ncbi:MAG TPA: alpha/beta hydrolase [Candidatus Kapabacteria bacterium]|nr:alpha/beta hydrolase [Candidatus Kapabacteria bacterium]